MSCPHNSIHLNRPFLTMTVERLERRRLLAGDVEVFVNANGDLMVNGDNLDNQLAILATDNAGQYLIQSLDGVTTINGQSEQTLSGITNRVQISLDSGANVLRLGSASSDLIVPGDLEITARNEGDNILLRRVEVSGRTEINLRGGNNVIDLVDSEFLQSCELRTGSGSDAIEYDGSFVTGDVVMQTGSDDDDIRFSFSDFSGNVSIKSGSDDDRIVVTDSDLNGELQVRTSGGDDDVQLVETDFEIVRVDAGGGDDRVRIDTASGDFTIRTGGGDDRMTLENLFSSVQLNLQGGGGDDFLLAGDSLQNVSVTMRSIEQAFLV